MLSGRATKRSTFDYSGAVRLRRSLRQTVVPKTLAAILRKRDTLHLPPLVAFTKSKHVAFLLATYVNPVQ